jgi:hypothetical protein
LILNINISSPISQQNVSPILMPLCWEWFVWHSSLLLLMALNLTLIKNIKSTRKTLKIIV